MFMSKQGAYALSLRPSHDYDRASTYPTNKCLFTVQEPCIRTVVVVVPRPDSLPVEQ